MNDVSNLVNKIKRFSKIPICSGFGIKTPADAKDISSIDIQGVVVGTAFVDFIEKNLNDKQLKILEKLQKFCKTSLMNNWIKNKILSFRKQKINLKKIALQIRSR